MRLFLSSHDFGNYKTELLKLTKNGRKTLIIANARDFLSDDDRQSVVSRKLALFRDAGFEAEELDLRQYFGRKEQLAEFIESYRPNLIFAIGGNVFLLSTAYRLSGFAEILLNDLKQDKYVYGGGSAGAMVLVNSLKYYGHDNLVPEIVPEIYGADAVMDGLGLIDQYVVPHADEPKFAEPTKEYCNRLKQNGKEIALINRNSAFIIDGFETTYLE